MNSSSTQFHSTSIRQRDRWQCLTEIGPQEPLLFLPPNSFDSEREKRFPSRKNVSFVFRRMSFGYFANFHKFFFGSTLAGMLTQRLYFLRVNFRQDAGNQPRTCKNGLQTVHRGTEKVRNDRYRIQEGLKETPVLYLREAGLVQYDSNGNDIVLRPVHSECRSGQPARLGGVLP